MNLQTLFLIISCSISVIGITSTIITTILKHKDKNDIKIAQILQSLPECIKEAESIFGAGNGIAKLTFVLNKINIACLSQGLDFNSEVWQNAIENILETPKKKNI